MFIPSRLSVSTSPAQSLPSRGFPRRAEHAPLRHSADPRPRPRPSPPTHKSAGQAADRGPRRSLCLRFRPGQGRALPRLPEVPAARAACSCHAPAPAPAELTLLWPMSALVAASAHSLIRMTFAGNSLSFSRPLRPTSRSPPHSSTTLSPRLPHLSLWSCH
jgi:hypothetical protein